MGDRANVYVAGYNEGPGVFLYTHWTGTNLPATVQRALKRGEDRWTDGQYLARIVFSEMIVDDVEGTTGFGIGAEVGDGDDRIIALNPDTQEVSVNGGPSVSFKDFVALPNPTWGRSCLVFDPNAPLTEEQRRALFATFGEVFGHTEQAARLAFTRLVLSNEIEPADARVSWSQHKPGALTAYEASQVLDALDALNV